VTRFIGSAYSLVMVVFFIAFLISWCRLRKQVRGYRRYGILAGIILIAFEILVLLSAGSEARSSMSLSGVIVTDAIAFVRIMAYTIVGTYMCTMLGHPSFPLLKPRMELPEPAEIEVGRQQPSPPKVNIATYAAIIMAVVVGAVAYSALLFFLTSPEMSDTVKQGYGESASGTGNTVSLMQLIVVLEFAFAEEIVFRLGIQNYLAKQLNWRGEKYWIAITLTAALWTSAHIGLLEPDWVKLVQVFPMGLALGWLFRKLGTESCILAHALFNVAMVFVSPPILG
jgi:membrane protease YdiL (CAAX protease family)